LCRRSPLSSASSLGPRHRSATAIVEFFDLEPGWCCEDTWRRSKHSKFLTFFWPPHCICITCWHDDGSADTTAPAICDRSVSTAVCPETVSPPASRPSWWRSLSSLLAESLRRLGVVPVQCPSVAASSCWLFPVASRVPSCSSVVVVVVSGCCSTPAQ